MVKKFLAIVFATALLFSMSVVTTVAAPFEGGITISGDITIIPAVNFDTDDYLEFSAELAEAENHFWFFYVRDDGYNYAIRTEYLENNDGPQTEATDDSVPGHEDIGAICYTSGPWGGYDAEWVQYTLDVETAGTYGIKVWASTDAGKGKYINVYWNGELIGSPEILREGWITYNLHDLGAVVLAKGIGVLKLEFATGDVNVAAFEVTLFEVASTPTPVTALPSPQKVLVNGEEVAFDAYNINGNNYFKLRDLAYILNGTEKQFEVGYDEQTKAITLTSGKAYTTAGGEMLPKTAGNKTGIPTPSKIYLDGKEVKLTAYNIEGNNYFKLRDIGQALDFGVDWDSANNTIVIDTSKGYNVE